MAADDELWARLRHLYVETDEPITVFAKRFGVDPKLVSKRAVRDGWPRRSARRKPAAVGSRPSGPVAKHPTRAARDALIRRFYRAISAKLSEWEKDMLTQDVELPADNEGRIKELGVLIQNFEKVADVAAGAQKLDDAPGKKQPRGSLTSADTQRMREEIARRLEHLGASRNAGGGLGAAAGGADPEPDA